MSDLDGRAGRQATRIEYYDTPTLIFHWLTVVFVVLLFGSAFTWNFIIGRNRDVRSLLENGHVSLGIAFAVLVLVRVVWRLTASRRLTPHQGLSGTLSRIMYGLLYLLLVAQTGLGFVLRWSQGEDFSFFGLFTIPALLGENRDFAHQVETWHNWGGWAIVILSLGHAAAALVHHYVLKDRVLSRMGFRRRPASLEV